MEDERAQRGKSNPLQKIGPYLVLIMQAILFSSWHSGRILAVIPTAHLDADVAAPVDSRHPPCLIYVRIPKAASSSLLTALQDALGLTKGFMCYRRNGKRGLPEYQALTSHSGEQHMYQGHCDFGFNQYVCLPPHQSSRRCYYYTWLREPISRVVSSIAYAFRRRGLPDDLTAIRVCLEQGCSCELSKGPNWSNMMTYMLGTDLSINVQAQGPVNVTRHHLEVAKRRLQNDFIAFGLLEYQKESLEMLNKVLLEFELPSFYDDETTYLELQSPLTNSGKSKNKDRIANELTTAIVEANQLDIELYDFARGLFLEVSAQRDKPETTLFRENTRSVLIHSCSPKPNPTSIGVAQNALT